MTERIKCPVCGKWVATFEPAGGDGSGVFMRKHRDDSTGNTCKSRWRDYQGAACFPGMEFRHD